MAGLQVVGGGRMGEALVGGLLEAGGHAPRRAWSIVEPIADPAGGAARRSSRASTSPTRPSAAEGTVIAVKPGDVPAACRAVAGAGSERVLSIAAGVTLATLEEHLADGTAGRAGDAEHPRARRARRVGHRARHRTPATPIWPGPSRSSPPSASSSGSRSRCSTPSPACRDPDRPTCSSSPRRSSRPGVLAGLPREVSEALSVQTLLGAATLLATSDDGAEALRAAVTSPGGTTAAGLRVLEQHGAPIGPPGGRRGRHRPQPGARRATWSTATTPPLATPATGTYASATPLERGAFLGNVITAPSVAHAERGRRAAAGLDHDRVPADQVR